MIKQVIKIGIQFIIILTVVYGLRFYITYNEQAEHAEKVLTTISKVAIKGLDPTLVTDFYSDREVQNVYEGLVSYHYLKRPITLQANLAEALPIISEDGLVYTFTLKQGVLFQDNACFVHGKGRELVAEDFVYTMKRVADPKVGAPHFSLLAGKIKGLDAWRSQCTDAAQTDYTASIAGIQAVDKYTLRFTLNKPFPQFLYILAMSCCYVVPHEAVQHYGDEFMNHPVGTGPFMVKWFNPQENKITYYKNPTFRKTVFPNEAAPAYEHLLDQAGKPLPFLDKLITRIVPEEQPAWLQFQKGQVDFVDVSQGMVVFEAIDADTKQLSPLLQEKGIQLCCEASMTSSFFAFNYDHALFHNKKLRQAISMAFDRERFNALFFNNLGTLAQSIVPPGLAGYQADYRNPYTYDVEKAKQRLAEAGYPGGKGLPTITLDTSSDTAAKHRADFFAKCMEAIGIQIIVIQNTFPGLLKKINESKSTMLHAIGWNADYPDAANFLFLLASTERESMLITNFNDPVFNARYQKASALPDSLQRTTWYEQLNRMAAEEAPVVYTVHPPRCILQQGWVKNYVFSDFQSGAMQFIDIDVEKKKAMKSKF